MDQSVVIRRLVHTMHCLQIYTAPTGQNKVSDVSDDMFQATEYGWRRAFIVPISLENIAFIMACPCDL